MKISYKNILIITFVSSLIGLIYNNLNPKGIPLIKEKKELVFESDTLLLTLDEKKEMIQSDSLDNKSEQTKVSKESDIKK
ncbi:MAG: hypothetical protein NZM09_09820, partial [Ignavibacterium sp.]|nr:hypothetical protein [Ignavibacterium sp.]MDW8375975.1 hypothetical protein [Ignavibacteriales bacterium]